MFPEVNPSAESTWKNHSAPGAFKEFQRALIDLAGTSVNGHPNLRLQWAPDRFKWILGRPRRFYVDTRIPTRRKVNRIYYQVKDLTDPFAAWQTVEMDELGKYPGSKYLHVVHHDAEIVTICRQQFSIEQYFSPDRLDETPEAWNKRRFRFFTPPETNIAIYGDDIGPYPHEGDYRLVCFIDGGRDYSYRAPDERALELLRACWQERERYRRTVSRAKEIANDYAAAEEKDRKRVEDTLHMLDGELKPYERKAEGNAFISVP
jgi:hypothetical protein